VDDAGVFCAFVRPDGQRCRGRARTGRTCCFAHDPESREARAAACRAGGKRRSQRAVTLPEDTPDHPLATVGDVCSFLARVINATSKGQLDVRVCNAVTYAASTLTSALARGDLEQRLAAVEQLLAQPKAGGAA
jgi:hypothetical protein